MIKFNQLETLNKCLIDWNVNYSVYPYSGYTINEVLCQFYDAINSGIITINEYTKMVGALKEWIENEGLKKEVNDALSDMMNTGALGSLINDKLLKDINDKLDKLYSAKSVSIDLYYEDDFFTAIKKAIDDGYLNINCNGDYLVKSPCDIENISNLSIYGNFNLKLSGIEYIDKICSFVNCRNLTIEGCNIKGNNKSIYLVFNFTNCENLVIDSLSMNNIRNVDHDKQFFGLKVNSKNFSLNNIYFNNITHSFVESNLTTGKGAIQPIYISIDDINRFGNINNVRFNSIYNLDETGYPTLGDCDVIKLQYKNNGYPSVNNISAGVNISNITGFNCGKRVVKSQVKGVEIVNINVMNSLDGVFSCVALHYGDSNISNIKFKGNSKTFIELGIMASDINMNNLYYEGNAEENLISCGSFNRKTTYLQNIIISNINVKSNIELDFIRFYQPTKNIVLDKILFNGVVKGSLIGTAYNDDTMNYETNITSSKFTGTINTIGRFTCQKALINLYNTTVDCADASNINLPSLHIKGELKIEIMNSNIKCVNNRYIYGAFKLNGDTKIENSFIYCDGETTLTIEGDTSLRNVVTNHPILLKSDNFVVDNTQGVVIEKISKSTGSIINCKPIVKNDINILNSPIFLKNFKGNTNTGNDVIFDFENKLGEFKIISINSKTEHKVIVKTKTWDNIVFTVEGEGDYDFDFVYSY